MMRKAVLVTGGVLVAGAAGWSALWFMGQGEVTDRIGIYLDSYRAQGFEISHGDPEVTGFPFGYAVRYPDITAIDPSGLRIELPALTGAADVSGPDTVRIEFADSLRMFIPTPPEMREDDPGFPAEITVEAELDSLVTLLRIDSDTVLSETTATSVLVTVPQLAPGLALAAEYAGLSIDGITPLVRGPLKTTTTVDEFTMKATFQDADQPDILITADFQADDVTAITEMAGDLGLLIRQLTDPALAADAGTIDLTVQSGAVATRVRAGEEGDPEGGTLDYSAGTTAASVLIADGQVKVSGEYRNIAYVLTPNEDSMPYRGGLSADSAEIHYDVPVGLAPDAPMAPFSLRLALLDLTGDETFWRALDPYEALARTPGHLFLDISGSAKPVSEDFAAFSTPGGALLPGNVEIATVELAAFGSTFTAEGAFEFLQPGMIPVGSATLNLTAGTTLINTLAEAGLLDPVSAQMGAAILQVYAEPGPALDSFTMGIESGPGGVLVNGRPVQ